MITTTDDPEGVYVGDVCHRCHIVGRLDPKPWFALFSMDGQYTQKSASEQAVQREYQAQIENEPLKHCESSKWR